MFYLHERSCVCINLDPMPECAHAFCRRVELTWNVRHKGINRARLLTGLPQHGVRFGEAIR